MVRERGGEVSKWVRGEKCGGVRYGERVGGEGENGSRKTRKKEKRDF